MAHCIVTLTAGIEYALGWEYLTKHEYYSHGGFTCAFNLVNLFIRAENIAFLAITNGDTKTSTKAIDSAIQLMPKRYRAKDK